MTGRTDGPHDEVVRAGRFEVVDAQGRVRAVIGALGDQRYPTGAGSGDGRGGGGGGEVVGVELRDRAGSARAWLTVEEGWGAQLCLAEGGNQVLLLDVVEAGPEAAEPGPVIRLCDATGAPVAEWRVAADGRFVQRLPPPA